MLSKLIDILHAITVDPAVRADLKPVLADLARLLAHAVTGTPNA